VSASNASLVRIARLRDAGWADVVFAFCDNEEVGPRLLARIAKITGLKPEDL
jgi:hypothetical protein